LTIATETVRIRRKFARFDLVEEKWTDETGNTLVMDVYRSKKGDHIDTRRRGRRPNLIKWLDKRGISAELANPSNNVCSVGKAETDGKWYGWSHRAMVGFGIGDKLFDPLWGLCEASKSYLGCGELDEDGETVECEACSQINKTPFVLRGVTTIKTDAEARQAAVAFAGYIG
jgi:hypothetical protein